MPLLMQVTWVSKASAEQRAGRAGRTGPGHCYRLYSSAHYVNTFPEHAAPAILNVPIEGVVLQMKSMGIDKVVHFPFPTPPELAVVAAAERALARLGALGADGALTSLGRAMAQALVRAGANVVFADLDVGAAAKRRALGPCLTCSALCVGMLSTRPSRANSSEVIQMHA